MGMKPRSKTTRPWAKEFRAAREEMFLPAKELASLLDVTPETVSRWENGKRDVPWMVIKTMEILVSQHRRGDFTLMRLLHAQKHPRPPLRYLSICDGGKTE